MHFNLFNLKLSNSECCNRFRVFDVSIRKHCDTLKKFLKLWHAENENTNKICNCTMHYDAALQELNSKSHLKCLPKCSNRKEQTCRINKLTNRLTLERIFLKEHVRHDDDIKKTQGFDACKNTVKLNSVRLWENSAECTTALETSL